MLIFISTWFGMSAAAALNIMPIEQVHAGMKGQGRTVFQGTEAQAFDVDVLGILPG